MVKGELSSTGEHQEALMLTTCHAYVKAERGKETMALNNSDELKSLVLEVLGQAVGALSLIGETTESPEDT